MKLTKSQLKQIIKEELGKTLNEAPTRDLHGGEKTVGEEIYDKYKSRAFEKFGDQRAGVDDEFHSFGGQAEYEAGQQIEDLLKKNPNPAEEEILNAILTGWHRGDW